jgi:copper(I)-binding protein
MRMDGGVMKMRELANGVEIPAGATVELKPGSYHVMMLGLSKGTTRGERLKASLTFEKAGKVDIEFDVEAVGGTPAGRVPAKEHKH